MYTVIEENTQTKKLIQPYEAEKDYFSKRSGAYFRETRLRKHSESWEKISAISNIEMAKKYSWVSDIFKGIYNEIEKSKYILDLKDDYDDEGAESYSYEIWEKATKFLIDNAKEIFFQKQKVIDTPRILHGPNGSIDILWKNSEYRLLINIDSDSTLSFYGDYYKESKKFEGEDKLESVSSKFLQYFLCQ